MQRNKKKIFISFRSNNINDCKYFIFGMLSKSRFLKFSKSTFSQIIIQSQTKRNTGIHVLIVRLNTPSFTEISYGVVCIEFLLHDLIWKFMPHISNAV